MSNSNTREDLKHDNEINQIDVADDRMSATFALLSPKLTMMRRTTPLPR